MSPPHEEKEQIPQEPGAGGHANDTCQVQIASMSGKSGEQQNGLPLKKAAHRYCTVPIV